MKMTSLFAAAVLAFSGTAGWAQYSRDQQTAACSGDAMRLCGDAIPDETKVEACMNARRDSLSEKCRLVFDGSEAPKRRK